MAPVCPKGRRQVKPKNNPRRQSVLYLIRDARETPAGAKLKGRIFYGVPVQGGGFNPPANTVLITPVRVQDLGPRLVITLHPGGSAISVTFVVR